jgi:L-asparaginase
MTDRPSSAPRVDVLSLGGTIAMAPVSAGGGVEPTLGAEQLVAAVPELARIADVHAQSVRSLPGASLGLSDLLAVATAARAAVDAGSRGVVVTQGTDSLEESAYVLDLVWDRPEPLVVTGAMRPASAAGADGPANIAAAVAVAASAAARERGCLVAFADRVFAARAVAKVHSTRPDAFAAPGAGPIGALHEGAVRFDAPPAARAAALAPLETPVPSVAVVPAVLGDDGRLLRAATAAGFDGLVLAAMGAGHVPRRLLEPIAEAVDRLPLVAASRTGAGRLLHGTYGFSGSERDLWAAGLLDAGALSPLKARILLTLAIWSAPGDRVEQERLFSDRVS